MLRMVLTDKRPITPARKIDNDKDGEMKLTVGLALTLAIMTCGAQARDMQTIEHSGELKVGVPRDYAPLAFRNAAGELQG